MSTDEIVRALRNCGGGPEGMKITRAAADLIESLQAQLAASQREKRAAVKDIEKMMRICEKGSCHFCANGDCTESPYCSPKWRGPQEAEKGKAE